MSRNNFLQRFACRIEIDVIVPSEAGVMSFIWANLREEDYSESKDIFRMSI